LRCIPDAAQPQIVKKSHRNIRKKLCSTSAKHKVLSNIRKYNFGRLSHQNTKTLNIAAEKM
jgi:hypothetical protein